MGAAAEQVQVHLAGAFALWLQLLIYRIDHVFIDGLVKDPMQTDKVKLEACHSVALGRVFNFVQPHFIICKMGLRVRR